MVELAFAQVTQVGASQVRRDPVPGVGAQAGFADLRGDRLAAAVTLNGQLDLLAHRRQADFIAQVRDPVHRLAVHFQHHVAGLEPRFIGGAFRQHIGDHHALAALHLEGAGQFLGEILNGHAEHPAAYFAVLDQLVHNVHRHVGGDGEADAHIAAGGGEDGGVDTDQLAVEIDQRAAGVARVNGGVGLNKILVALDTQAGAAQRRHDTGGHRLTETEGVADGDHEITHLETGGIGDTDLRQVLGAFQFQHRQVDFLVQAHQFRRQFTAVDQGHFDFVGVSRHMGVGEHVALVGVDDHAGAGGHRAAAGRLIRHVEKAAEERVLHQRILGRPHPGFNGDIDHRRGGLFHHRRQ